MRFFNTYISSSSSSSSSSIDTTLDIYPKDTYKIMLTVKFVFTGLVRKILLPKMHPFFSYISLF